MDTTYRPLSPELGPLSGARPISPDLSSTNLGHHEQHSHLSHPAAGYSYGYQPTSIPQYYNQQQQYHHPSLQTPMAGFKSEQEDDWMPDAPQPPTKRARKVKQEQQPYNGSNAPFSTSTFDHDIKSENMSDPTLGCQIRTSFPVARIKRIMQADEDIGKVAQVTPTVVSRALELFMIKLISAAAHEARGSSMGGGGAKGQKRVLAQHLKRAVFEDDKLDFLREIVGKVPDAPVKAKKEAAAAAGSDSEEAQVKPKRKSKKRKDSGEGDDA